MVYLIVVQTFMIEKAMKMKLTEAWEQFQATTEPELNKEALQTFVKKVQEYHNYGKTVYSEGNLVEVAKDLSAIAKIAHQFALREVDTFDKITVNRNMNELQRLTKEFEKAATEVQGMRDRVAVLYEDIGYILDRYYPINDAQINDSVEQPVTRTAPPKKR